MKRLISATLALTLLGSTAAMAAPAERGDRNITNVDYRGHGHDNTGAIVAGIGLFALAAVLATHHDRYDGDRYYNYGGYDHGYRNTYGYRDNYGYGNGYHRSYGDRDGYGRDYGSRHDRDHDEDRGDRGRW